MHDIHVLADLLKILAVSLVVVWAFRRLNLPSIVGFLVTGVLLGPGVFGLITSRAEIELMAEIGVVLLLFTIGLELSLKEMGRLKKFVFGAGGIQVLLTAAVVTTIAIFASFETNSAIFLGSLVAVSSTAIVLRLLAERGEMGSVHGRMALSILIFQDLVIVPFMLLIPILAGEQASTTDVLWTLAKAAALIVGMLVAADRIIPWIFERVVKARSRELFTLATVVLALGTAYLTGLAGLSLALGAFLAGLVISESPYSHQMMTEILPFRDVFNSIFFVSVGMLVEPMIFVEQPLVMVALIVGIILLKTLLTGGITLAFGFGPRFSLLTGLALAQVGEFAFVLAHAGMKFGLLSQDHYGLFLGSSVATMALTPALFAGSNWLVDKLSLPANLLGKGGQLTGVTSTGHQTVHETVDEHVIIVGYGLNGRNVARVLRDREVPYLIAEVNPKTVAHEREQGEPIVYGDASQSSTLEHLGVEKARALVVTVADASTARRVVSQARQLNHNLVIFARTRFISEVEQLFALGADEIIPEEFETSLELAGLIMTNYGASEEEVLAEKNRLRKEGYRAMRGADHDEYA